MLIRYLDEIFSFTSDMGTEVKITDYKIDRLNLRTVMPDWLADRRTRSPLVEEHSTSPAPERSPLLQCQGDHFLRNALPVSGVGHMIHNSVKGFADVLQHFAAFFLQLKVVEMALKHKGRCERICATCLRGTPYAKHIDAFMNCSQTLHESRWTAVAAFCAASTMPLGVLRRCYSASAYLQRGRGELVERQWEKTEDRKFDANELQTILKSGRFRNYHGMVIKLHRVPGRLQSWFDACPCHEALLLFAANRHQRAKILREDGLAAGKCPCSTCRGWEVVDGKLGEVINTLGDESKDQLQEAIESKESDGLTEPMSQADHALIFLDFSAGIAHLQLSFGVRLRWGTELPWMLMGLAHPIVSRAQHWGRRCIQAYSAKSEDQHHRRSILYLKPGSPLRTALDMFVASGSMPGLLRLHVAVFYFIPLGDRNIEREHKYLSDVVRPKTRVILGHWFSVRRLRIVEKRMFVDAVFADGLVDKFLSLKSTKSVIHIFGLEKHPLFQDMMRNQQGRRDKAVNQVVRRVLEQVVYRQELGMKYTTFDFARKTNAAADEKWRGAERKTHMKPRVIPTTVDELLLLNASDHLQAVGKAVGFITMRHQLAGGIGLNTTVLSEDLSMPDATLQDNEGEADASESDGKDEGDAVDSEEEGQPPKRQRMDANDAIVPVAEEEESIEQLTCFRMLKSRPGGIKSLATYIEKGGTKVSPTSFAVTLHSCEECPETGALIVDGQPRAMGSSGMRAVVVDSLNPGLSLPALYASMHGHINQGQPSLRMSLPVTMRGSQMDLHVALDKMLQARAVDGRHGGVEGDVSLWPWATLVESGFVKIVSTDASDISRPNHCCKQINTWQPNI